MDERRSLLVYAHCARMGYVVRCIRSGMDVAAAAELRNELELKARDLVRKWMREVWRRGSCFLAEVAAEPVWLTFAECVKQTEGRR